MKIISTYGAVITPASFLRALSASNLHWAMSRAQRLSVEYLALWNTIQIRREVSADNKIEQFSASLQPNTLGGIPYTIDDSLDPTWIELRQDDKVLVRIENLAVPAGADQVMEKP